MSDRSAASSPPAFSSLPASACAAVGLVVALGFCAYAILTACAMFDVKDPIAASR